MARFLSARVEPSAQATTRCRSEEHTSELQSLAYLVCRLLLEKKNTSRDGPLLGAPHSAVAHPAERSMAGARDYPWQRRSPLRVRARCRCGAVHVSRPRVSRRAPAESPTTLTEAWRSIASAHSAQRPQSRWSANCSDSAAHPGEDTRLY